MSLYIKSVGHYTPPRRLSNKDLESMVDTNDEWITSRTGIRERAIADKGVGTADMAYHASVQALEEAGMDAKEMDGIVCATCTPDMTMPGASSHLQRKLGGAEVAAFDVNAACSGFIYGLDVVDGMLASGRYENILLACADKFTSTINYNDRGTCILFGDGAGSLVLSSKPGGPKLSALYTGGNGQLTNLLHRPGGGSLLPFDECEDKDELYVQMIGNQVFKHAVRGMGLSATETLKRAGWDKSEVDWLIPHQANRRLIDAAMDRLGLAPERVVVNIEKYGNMSAASIPVALNEAKGQFKPGDKILCVAFGSGFTWGGAAIEWA
ncbi:MAG: ketoacyl-ACP synthase III [Planctomycetes bacterium]|nr:ketoacyl-ACP synthase III [Planctomycetota bacterium]